jgi:hypothetical protein
MSAGGQWWMEELQASLPLSPSERDPDPHAARKILTLAGGEGGGGGHQAGHSGHSGELQQLAAAGLQTCWDWCMALFQHNLLPDTTAGAHHCDREHTQGC